jgi:hypothetical protein
MLIGNFCRPFGGSKFQVGKEECGLFFGYLKDGGGKLIRNISDSLPVQADSSTRTRQLSSETL